MALTFALYIATVLPVALLCSGLASPPGPGSGLRLELVVTLFRHGDRSPLYSWPSDVLPLSGWPDGAGQLTPVGIRAQYELGALLRQHYIDGLNFISPSYRRSEIYIRSTDIDRTLMSAQSHLSGLYPKGSASLEDVRSRFGGAALDKSDAGLPGRAQPIPVHTAPMSIDGLLIPGGACPRHVKLQEEKRLSRAWLEKEEEEQVTLKRITHATKSTTPLRLNDISRVGDTWKVQRAHLVPLPKGADVLYDRVVELAQWTQNFTNAGVEARRLRAGLLLHEISRRARVAVANRAGKLTPEMATIADHRKYVVFSAHDTTVAAALAALDLFDGVNPPYNSTLIWEVYTQADGTKGSDRSGVVRVLYNKKPLLLPGCDGRVFCPLKTYLASTKAVTVPSTATRTRECLTGAARLRADMLALFWHDPHDTDDVVMRMHTGGKWIAWLLFGVGIVAIVAILLAILYFRTRYAGYSSELWAQVDDDRLEQRKRKSFGEANAERAILM